MDIRNIRDIMCYHYGISPKLKGSVYISQMIQVYATLINEGVTSISYEHSLVDVVAYNNLTDNDLVKSACRYALKTSHGQFTKPTTFEFIKMFYNEQIKEN